ncbi:MAG TPA: HDIG domain-containing protein [Chloroflexia bacterium]|nr:HDIG domain-containing protein [Chloroflexia bacterium]
MKFFDKGNRKRQKATVSTEINPRLEEARAILYDTAPVEPAIPGPSASSVLTEEASPVKEHNIWQQWRLTLAHYNWMRLLSVSLFAFVVIGAVSFALVWRFDDNIIARQQVGEVALADWMAPKSHSYISAVKTKELGDAAAANPANNVYKRDPNVVTRERQNLNNLLDLIGNIRTNSYAVLDIASLTTNPTLKASGLDNDQLIRLFNLPESTWTQVSQEARNVFSILMNRDIMANDVSNVVTVLKDAVYTPYTLSATLALLEEGNRELTVDLVKPFIKSNMVLDEAATRKKQDEARSQVGAATVDIVKGTAIVRRGDVLTPLQFEKLRELGLLESNYTPGQVIGTVGIVSCLILLLIIYCSQLAGQIWATPRWLAFIGFCIIVASIAMRILIVDAGRDSYRAYLLPLAAIAMVIAALFDVQLALFLGALLALLAGLVSGVPELVIVFFAGSAAAALAIRKAEHTSVFAYAGIAVTLSQSAISLLAIVLNGNLETSNVSLILIFSALNGLISASLAFFCFSVLGKLFGVATVLQLLELAHPNQPLLRRLIREAPGTYHHSIMVSNLAEQAAERIADNALLARVGAYYHDIGKLVRPSYYIDNQAGGANIHDTLDPRESARLIKAHVSDGVALARKHHLPRRVVDIIHQHHGTCMISFFYQKAVKMGLDVNEIDFHYPGPKPQTKVAAIVMLADGCEAAVRANVQSGRILTGTRSSVPGSQSGDIHPHAKHLTIQDVVNKIIDDRIREHQLSECDLTLRDIEEIRTLFVEILNGIYHPRIVYPDKEPVVAATPTPEATAPSGLTALNNTVEQVRAVVTHGAADSGGEVLLKTIEDDTAVEKLESPVAVAEKPETDRQDTSKRDSAPSGIGGAGHIVSDPPPGLSN